MAAIRRTHIGGDNRDLLVAAGAERWHEQYGKKRRPAGTGSGGPTSFSGTLGP
jgi:hypothetical protein